MPRRKPGPVPRQIAEQVEAALAVVEQARRACVTAVVDRAPLEERRRCHAALGAALLEADVQLRQATSLAKARSHHEWSAWRRRLSAVDTLRQQHLFLAQDDAGVPRLGSIRAVDTGMAGPAIGDLMHGDSKEPGTPARYGLDYEVALAELERQPRLTRRIPDAEGDTFGGGVGAAAVSPSAFPTAVQAAAAPAA